MKNSKSSRRWLLEHFNDEYVKKAQQEGYRSRAVYKLKEIDDKEHLFYKGMTVVDLGAAPGGWCQYIIKKTQGKSKIIALDLLPIESLEGVNFILGDFREDNILEKIMQLIPKEGVDLILSDMAPNMSGVANVDIPCAMYLAELAFDFANKILKPSGSLLIKLFHGAGFDDLVKLAKTQFNRVIIKKPQASRARSKETYLLAQGYRQKF